MLFNSIQFVYFFIIIVGLYFLTVHRYRWVLLLAGSYYFYMCWKAEYIVLILLSTLIDYFAALKMGATSSKTKKRVYLGVSLVSNLSLLFVFKYYNFISDSLTQVLNRPEFSISLPHLDLLLPVGISFYTFQTLSYSIDVYRGDKKPERHFGIFALYVSFFPQLVAGPIERSTSLLPQLHSRVEFDYNRVMCGLRLMLWGFFKKIVIADRLAILVDGVYSQPSEFSGLTLLIASVFFAFQIYCDFSGYSDIAIGGAQVLGISLMKNFNSPYQAKSISDFWSRWHISLSSWFRDYLYIPLGGNRVVKWRWYYNLLIVFMVSGLWHGANWTFLVWGALHGWYLIFAIMTLDLRERIVTFTGLARHVRLYSFMQIVTTFVLVQIAWIFFRANSVQEALTILREIAGCVPVIVQGILNRDFFWLTTAMDEMFQIMRWHDFVLAVMLIGFLEVSQRYGKGLLDYILSAENPSIYRWTLYYAASLSILLFGKFGVSEFIYFQF